MIKETQFNRNNLTSDGPEVDALQTELPGWLRALPLILLGVFAIVLMARFLTPGDVYLSNFEDDYFYYLVVAKNIVLHGLSSFDGVRQTNGYQPLWQAINIGLYWIFGDHRALFLALLGAVPE